MYIVMHVLGTLKWNCFFLHIWSSALNNLGRVDIYTINYQLVGLGRGGVKDVFNYGSHLPKILGKRFNSNVLKLLLKEFHYGDGCTELSRQNNNIFKFVFSR